MIYRFINIILQKYDYYYHIYINNYTIETFSNNLDEIVIDNNYNKLSNIL